MTDISKMMEKQMEEVYFNLASSLAASLNGMEKSLISIYFKAKEANAYSSETCFEQNEIYAFIASLPDGLTGLVIGNSTNWHRSYLFVMDFISEDEIETNCFRLYEDVDVKSFALPSDLPSLLEGAEMFCDMTDAHSQNELIKRPNFEFFRVNSLRYLEDYISWADFSPVMVIHWRKQSEERNHLPQNDSPSLFPLLSKTPYHHYMGFPQLKHHLYDCELVSKFIFKLL